MFVKLRTATRDLIMVCAGISIVVLQFEVLLFVECVLVGLSDDRLKSL